MHRFWLIFESRRDGRGVVQRHLLPGRDQKLADSAGSPANGNAIMSSSNSNRRVPG